MPVLFIVSRRTALGWCVGESVENARKELVEAFNEGQLDSMSLGFIVPISQENTYYALGTVRAGAQSPE
ncbi:hypothetical protein [Ralstonia phage BHDT_So9]|uniref:Uncharacterized protein n=1 Tax=Ralstonia phage BHDT_So9 TaxID=2972464 RepID=A0A9E7QY88_9CAUD|nr:hypothetical protein [Ralstonia phage BHDT_So9]UWI83535.1 hypothetical protein [Ralstonia phage DLDT_So2]UZT26923.1 tail tubular protein B [Ralstonia phage BHDTSo81]WEM03451.1 hypothetical protein [Ralstonia phage BHDT8]